MLYCYWFKDFKIETVSSMVEKAIYKSTETLMVRPWLKTSTKPRFTANLDITDFAYKKDTIGTVKIQVDNGLANTLNTKIGITGQGESSRFNGYL
jgi:hypothetical protein